MKVSLISLGCPKNQVAAEQMLAALAAAGHEITPDPAEAEAVVVNTCAFIEDAKQEAIDTLLEAAQLKSGRLSKRFTSQGSERIARPAASRRRRSWACRSVISCFS